MWAANFSKEVFSRWTIQQKNNYPDVDAVKGGLNNTWGLGSRRIRKRVGDKTMTRSSTEQLVPQIA